MITNEISIPHFQLSDEALNYLESSARIRKISRSRLLTRLFSTICEEQLILSILDDDGKQPSILPGEDHPTHFYTSRKIGHNV